LHSGREDKRKLKAKKLRFEQLSEADFHQKL